MRLKAIAILPVCGVWIAGAQLARPLRAQPASALSREGGYWVDRSTRSERVPARGRLKIFAPGSVFMQGTSDGSFSYTVVRRVKARNEASARARFTDPNVHFQVSGDSITLVARDAPGSSEIRVQAPRTLREVVVTSSGGNLEAFDMDGYLNVETGGGRLKLDRLGGNLLARTAGGLIECGAVNGSARCVSAGGPIRAKLIRGEAVFETAGGDIVVDEVGGSLRGSTAGGAIQVQRAGGPVIVDTAGGPIEVHQARGMVTARNSGGPILVGAAHNVRCETAGGAIRLNNVYGSLRAATAVGNIIAMLLAGQPVAESFLTTGEGDISVFIPSNVGVTVRAQLDAVGNARRIVSDFPGVVVRERGSSVTAEGPINGGGPELRLTSTSGTIFIRRQ